MIITLKFSFVPSQDSSSSCLLLLTYYSGQRPVWWSQQFDIMDLQNISVLTMQTVYQAGDLDLFYNVDVDFYETFPGMPQRWAIE